MAKQSAGILLYRNGESGPEFLLVHPGGPFWAKKDLHAWSVAKGEFEEEDPLDAAKREFEEETGVRLSGDFIRLEPVRQKSGKTVYCYALEGDIDTAIIRSNSFEIEWPPRSGRMQSFPEVDKAGWFSTEVAIEKINESQVSLIQQVLKILSEK
jgi:predicted NUDIX family NTP pyrophosphohydrolase